MATTQLLPIYAKIGRKILGRGRRAPHAGPVEIIEGMSRLWLAVLCPKHSWTWPRANRDERLGRYDSYQTCHKCMSRRMFDTQAWQSGPIYKRREDQSQHRGL